MDFNDITLRLKRVYSSINKGSDGAVEKYVRIIQTSPGAFHVTFDKGQEEAETVDVVVDIIEHLAKLKDHLKKKLETRGDNKNDIETEINASPALQLIIDLSNAEKHGYPLTHPERSGKSPRISNIKHALVVPPQKEFGINMRTGEIVNVDDCNILITAEILDQDGNLIYRLNRLVNDALSKWEEVIEKHHIS